MQIRYKITTDENASIVPLRYLLCMSLSMNNEVIQIPNHASIANWFSFLIRPSDVMGHDDRYLRYLNSNWRRCFWGYFPYWKKGEKTVKAPISVHDIATAVMTAFHAKHVSSFWRCIDLYYSIYVQGCPFVPHLSAEYLKYLYACIFVTSVIMTFLSIWTLELHILVLQPRDESGFCLSLLAYF